METKNIMIVGVGGQGTLLASKLLGRLSRYFHFTDEQWQDAIEKSVPAKFLERNRKAFALGAEA